MPTLYLYDPPDYLSRVGIPAMDCIFSDSPIEDYTIVSQPEQADYFTYPFPVDLIEEVTGEPQMVINALEGLAYINDPQYRSRHFFIARKTSGLSRTFPYARFFKTSFAVDCSSEEDTCLAIPPFVNIEFSSQRIQHDRFNTMWGMITSFPSELRTRIVLAASTLGGIRSSLPYCRNLNPQETKREPDSRWIGPHHYSLVKRVDGYCDLVEQCVRQKEEILQNSRFVLCPLERNGDWSDIVIALAYGRVPVIVTDETTLPYEKHIDWTRTGFVMGSSAGDLQKLRDIASISDAEYEEFSCRARAAWQECFAPAAVRQELFNYLSKIPEPQQSSLPLALDNRHQLMSAFWAQLAKTYSAKDGKKVVILGAGKIMQKWVRSILNSENVVPNIIGIADDDERKHGDVFCGFVIQGLEYYAAYQPDAVLLATDTFEDQMALRAESVFKQIDVIRFSDYLSRYSGSVFDTYQTVSSRSWQVDEASLDEAMASACYAPTHRYYPKKLEGLTVCVGYGDLLRWTLPHNIKHFDRYVIVTAPSDTLTQEVAAENGAVCVISPSVDSSGSVFNKGKLLNEGITQLDFDDWCLTLDADIILDPKMRSCFLSRVLNEKALYFTTRHDIYEKQVAWFLKEYARSGEIPAMPAISDSPEPYGFFQLFHTQSGPILCGAQDEVFPTAFSHAGGVDYNFAMRWAFHPECSLVDLPLKNIHIPHGSWGSNWAGRHVAEAGAEHTARDTTMASDDWQPLFYHSASSVTFFNTLPRSSGFAKYTRSDTGDCIIMPYCPVSILPASGCRLIPGQEYEGCFTCGVCGEFSGDVVLRGDSSGNGRSGWGVGCLKGTRKTVCCWAGTLMAGTTDFDMSFKTDLNEDEKEHLLSDPLYVLVSD